MPRPVVWAHRGASCDAPENTLAAFRAGLAAGADGVELDVHLTADGHVVVMHDANVARTTDGRGAISALTLEALRALDAGGGERVPTLVEVLELVMQWPGKDRRLLIELKGPFTGLTDLPAALMRRAGVLHHEAPFYKELTTKLVALLEPYKADVEAGRIVAQSFTMQYLRELRVRMPSLRLLYLTGSLATGWMEKEDLPGAAVSLGLAGVAVRLGALSAAAVANMQAKGLQVFAWTTDTARQLSAATSMGVDGLITNRPREALAALAALAAKPAGKKSMDLSMVLQHEFLFGALTVLVISTLVQLHTRFAISEA